MELAAKITGTGSAFPEKVVTNQDIVERIAKDGLETSDEWIRERTGMSERRHSDLSNPDELNSSLGAAAAEKAMEMAGKTAEDIDQIIYGTCSPDNLVLSSACWLQHKIGAKNAWAMDVNAACSGFIYGVSTAEKFIMAGQSKAVLVIGAEVLHPFINWKDRNSCILFGDGAGAAVIEPVPADATSRILSSHLLSDGDFWELLYVPAGGSSMETTPERFEQNLHKLSMKGTEIFKVAVRTLTEFAVRALEHNNLTVEELDWFVPHQANYRILEAVARRLKLPDEKLVLNVDRYANTSAATIPTALDEAVRDGRIKEGDTVLLDAFGAGLTNGSLLLRW